MHIIFYILYIISIYHWYHAILIYIIYCAVRKTMRFRSWSISVGQNQLITAMITVVGQATKKCAIPSFIPLLLHRLQKYPKLPELYKIMYCMYNVFIYIYPCVCRRGDVWRLPFRWVSRPLHMKAQHVHPDPKLATSRDDFYVLNTFIAWSGSALWSLKKLESRRAQVCFTSSTSNLWAARCMQMEIKRISKTSPPLKKQTMKNTPVRSNQEQLSSTIWKKKHEFSHWAKGQPPLGAPFFFLKRRGSMKNSEVKRWSEDSASSQQALRIRAEKLVAPWEWILGSSGTKPRGSCPKHNC
jgi:hypothetical protein